MRLFICGILDFYVTYNLFKDSYFDKNCGGDWYRSITVWSKNKQKENKPQKSSKKI